MDSKVLSQAIDFIYNNKVENKEEANIMELLLGAERVRNKFTESILLIIVLSNQFIKFQYKIVRLVKTCEKILFDELVKTGEFSKTLKTLIFADQNNIEELTSRIIDRVTL